MSKEAPIITASDLELVVQIIDTCSRRGAFEGKEMARVGEIRNKLDSVVNFHAQEPAGKTQVVTPSAGGPAETSE